MKGSQSPIHIQKEDFFGDLPSALAAVTIKYITNSISKDEGFEDDTVLDGYRESKRSFPGEIKVSGNLSVPVDVKSIEFWLEMLTGKKVVDVDNGTRTVIYTVDSEIPSFSAECGSGDYIILYKGLKVNSMDIDFSGKGGGVTAEVGIMGKDLTSSNLAVMGPTATLLEYLPFQKYQASIKVDDVVFGEISSISFKASNALESISLVGDEGKASMIPEGAFQVSGNIKSLVSPLFLEKGINRDDISIEIILTRGTDKISLTMNHVNMSYPKTPVEGPGLVYAEMSYKCFRDGDNDGFVATITNESIL